MRYKLGAVALGLALALSTSVAYADNEPCRGDNACQGRQKKGCAEASAPCSDDDKVTIIICSQPDSCRFEGETP